MLTENQGSFLGKPIQSGHQSHYVLTDHNGYPITEPQVGNEFTEVVIPQEAQVISIYLVYVTIWNPRTTTITMIAKITSTMNVTMQKRTTTQETNFNLKS